MVKTGVILINTLLLPACLAAQGGWLRKADLPASGRATPVAFSIGTKGYLGTGGYYNGSTTIYFNDYWEWDQPTNTWTQKASLPAVARRMAFGFSIGTKGYIGGGSTSTGGLQDFWEWDQASNTWTQKADFASGIRYLASSFSIGNKGYVGAGSDNFGANKNDFWEWDRASNTWALKATFGGPGRTNPVGFSIGTKGYMGTGMIGTPTTIFKDFWEWDQVTDTWTQKADVGGSTRTGAVGFSIGNKGYVGLGSVNDFWQWDPASNTWLALPYHPSGMSVYQAGGFSIGTKGYVCSGWYNSSNIFKELWELSFCDLAVTGTSATICKGQPITLNGSFTPASSNVTYMWVPASGLSNAYIPNPVASPSFSTVYTLTAKDTVTQCQVSKNYSVTIATPTITASAPFQICKGELVNLCAYGGVTYSWSGGQAGSCVMVSPTTTTTYIVNGYDPYGCQGADTVGVLVNNCSSTLNCNNNEGFELGDFSGWTGLTGTNSGGGVVSWSGGLNSLGYNLPPTTTAQHTIFTVSQMDPYAIDSVTSQPDVYMTTVSPTGGYNSVRLGNKNVGAAAEGLRVSFTPTASEPVFFYQYACVFQNAGHITPSEPGFMVRVYDGTNTIVPSLCDTLYGPDPVVPLLHVPPTAPDPSIVYKRWTTSGINLNPFIGQTMGIEFVNFDCKEAGHWGYTYLDVSCSGAVNVHGLIDPEMIVVYPNPAKDILTIYFQGHSGEGKAVLCDIYGKELYALKLDQVSGKIYLEGLKSGVYFLRITTGSGSSVKKIIRE